MKNKLIILKIALNTILFLSIATLSHCRKFVNVPAPSTRIAENNIFSSENTAIGAVTGILTEMSKVNTGIFTGINSMSFICGLSSDELTLWQGTSSTKLIGYFTNSLSPTANIGTDMWGVLYKLIYRTNAAIEGLNKSQTISDHVKEQLLGESKFLRAYFYYNLTNLFGNAPIVLTSDYIINSNLKKSTQEEILIQIEKDLLEALDLLSIEYLNENLEAYTSNPERVRPTKWSARALLSRVYLHEKKYQQAVDQSTAILNNVNKFKLTDINKVFLKNSIEAIWQLQPTTAFFNTEDARTFITPSTGPNQSSPAFLSTKLLNSFSSQDLRKDSGNWVIKRTINGIQYYSPFKYKINTQSPAVTAPTTLQEYIMLFRLAEQYLIRCESRLELNNLDEARQDLNAVRTRAGLQQNNSINKDTLKQALITERQLELFTEMGSRWIDIKRLNIIDSIMNSTTPLKAPGTNWMNFQKYYPIPNSDINNNPNLTQNPGY